MSHVAWSACLCVGHMGKLCKDGWTDRDAAWGLTYVRSRKHVLDRGRSFVRYCGQKPSLLWTTGPQRWDHIAVQCTCSGRGEELVGVCDVLSTCGLRFEPRPLSSVLSGRIQTSAWAHPPTKQLFQIIPTHMMNGEIIPCRKRGFDCVLYKLWPLQARWSSSVRLSVMLAWVKVNRLGLPLAGVIHSVR